MGNTQLMSFSLYLLLVGSFTTEGKEHCIREDNNEYCYSVDHLDAHNYMYKYDEGAFYQVQSIEDLLIGQHVYYHSCEYDHHAIITDIYPHDASFLQVHYTGNANPAQVSFASSFGGWGDAVEQPQIIATIVKFADAKKRNIHIRKYAYKFDGKEVVERANSRIGEKAFDLWSNNCEHFAAWCTIGNSQVVALNLAKNVPRIGLCVTKAAVETVAKITAVMAEILCQWLSG